MPELSSQGIVLRRKDTGESDRRLTLLTPELGKLDVTAKGARKGASRLAGVSEPLSCAVFGLAHGKKNYFVTQAQPVNSFRSLRQDFDRLSFALALCELYAAVIPYEEPSLEAYGLLSASLVHLESHPKPIVAFLWSEAALLKTSGFQPLLLQCVICGRQATSPVGHVSPRAGGFLCDEHFRRVGDSTPVRREVLIGLTRIGEVGQPPGNLKYAEECFSACLSFWRSYAESPLPANDALQRHLLSERSEKTTGFEHS